MAAIAHIEHVAYRSHLAEETLKVWRLSFQRALGLPEHNDAEDFSHHLRFLQQIPPANITLALNSNTGAVVGLLVQADEEIEQLYIHPSYQGMGIGFEFMQLAKRNSPLCLRLYTFAANTQAQAFYQRQGFVEIDRGQASANDNPWASDPAQLKDIRYQWLAENA